jgi:hypothetical protein
MAAGSTAGSFPVHRRAESAASRVAAAIPGHSGRLWVSSGLQGLAQEESIKIG